MSERVTIWRCPGCGAVQQARNEPDGVTPICTRRSCRPYEQMEMVEVVRASELEAEQVAHRITMEGLQRAEGENASLDEQLDEALQKGRRVQDAFERVSRERDEARGQHAAAVKEIERRLDERDRALDALVEVQPWVRGPNDLKAKMRALLAEHGRGDG